MGYGVTMMRDQKVILQQNEDDMTVWDKLNRSYYTTPSVSWPDTPTQPKIPRDPTPSELRAIADELEQYENRLVEYKRAKTAYNQEVSSLEQEFRNDLEAYYDMTNHPKADRLYNKAWDMGHASGLLEVANYYENLVELVKD